MKPVKQQVCEWRKTCSFGHVLNSVEYVCVYQTEAETRLPVQEVIEKMLLYPITDTLDAMFYKRYIL